MTGLVRKAAVLAACGVALGAAVAFAGVPSPANSPIPGRINLVGVDISAAPDTAALLAKYSFTVRDLANNPIANSAVVIDFNGDVSDTRIGDTQPYFGVTANCGTHGVQALTNASGVVTFVVQGGGKNPTGASHPLLAGKVYADGVLLGSVAVGQYDLDGLGGVVLADLSKWAGDYFSNANPERADYDNLGGVTLLDLSVWSGVYFASKSFASAATYCP